MKGSPQGPGEVVQGLAFLGLGILVFGAGNSFLHMNFMILSIHGPIHSDN